MEGITSILNYLNPSADEFFGNKIIELMKDMLKNLFVPSEEKILMIKDTVTSKFDFIESIKLAINSIQDMFNNVGSAPKLTLNLGATKYTEAGEYVILDLSWYAPFKVYGDLVLTGFIYLFFIWRLFVAIPGIITGTSSSISQGYEVFTGNEVKRK